MSIRGKDGLAGGTGGSRTNASIDGSAGKNVNKINKNGSAAPIKTSEKKWTLKEMKEYNDFVTSMNAELVEVSVALMTNSKIFNNFRPSPPES